MSSASGKKRIKRKPRRSRHTLGPGVGESLLDRFEESVSVNNEGLAGGSWTVLGPKPSASSSPSSFPPSVNPPVLVDPRAMKRHGWRTGDVLRLTGAGAGAGAERVCVVFPSDFVPPGHVRTTPSILKAVGMSTSITRIGTENRPIPTASRVVIQRAGLGSNKGDMALISAGLRGRYVIAPRGHGHGPEPLVDVSLYGRTTHFSVIEIDCVSENENENSSDGNGDGDGNSFVEVAIIGVDTVVECAAPAPVPVPVPVPDTDAKTETETSTSTISGTGTGPTAFPFPLDFIGGLGSLVSEVVTLLESALFESQSTRLAEYGLRPPRGVLLWGPSGSGKSMLAASVAAASGAHVAHLSSNLRVPGVSEGESQYSGDGEGEAYLRGVFRAASKSAPSIVIIDDVDLVAPARENSPSEAERRYVSALLSILDGAADPLRGVFVLATSSKPEGIDAALRRPGRLDREIELTVPSPPARVEIIKCALKQCGVRCSESTTESDLETVAAKCHGFVGADLLGLVQEASMIALKTETESGQSGAITLAALMESLRHVKPSAMREVFLDIPHVRWTDIGGQDDVKQKLKEAVEWPLKHAEAFARMRIQPPRGLLLYGPPGCSKTMMAKALATESGLNFVAVKGPELFSKWVGESERAVRRLFQRARAVAPSIIFLDEVDALGVKRGSSSGGSGVNDRVLSQLLMEMDGVESLEGVVVIGATNRPDMLDKALLRPGRFDHILYVGLPDAPARLQIFRNQLAKIPHPDDVTAEYLAEKTEGYSGAECVALCREAALLALHGDRESDSVSYQNFCAALGGVHARTSREMLSFFEKFRAQNAAAEL